MWKNCQTESELKHFIYLWAFLHSAVSLVEFHIQVCAPCVFCCIENKFFCPWKNISCLLQLIRWQSCWICNDEGLSLVYKNNFLVQDGILPSVLWFQSLFIYPEQNVRMLIKSIWIPTYWFFFILIEENFIWLLPLQEKYLSTSWNAHKIHLSCLEKIKNPWFRDQNRSKGPWFTWISQTVMFQAEVHMGAGVWCPVRMTEYGQCLLAASLFVAAAFHVVYQIHGANWWTLLPAWEEMHLHAQAENMAQTALEQKRAELPSQFLL